MERLPWRNEQGYEEYVTEKYREFGSLEQTTNHIFSEFGVGTSGSQISRIVRRNGGKLNGMGRPNKAMAMATIIKQTRSRFPDDKTHANHMGISPSTYYRALKM